MSCLLFSCGLFLPFKPRDSGNPQYTHYIASYISALVQAYFRLATCYPVNLRSPRKSDIICPVYWRFGRAVAMMGV
jgi:hypothetical protein